jgi:hypothetical protein
MFHGSIPADMQRMLHEHLKRWDCKEVFVGCSGNFTVERTLADTGLRFHSNDVTLYSSAIGSYLAGKPLKFSMSPAWREDWGFIEEDYFATPEDQLASLLLTSRFARDSLKQLSFYKRMVSGWRLQFPELHAKTAKKLIDSDLKLASYTPEDVATWIESVPPEAGFVSYPPFFGAAENFEKDFAALEDMWTWDKPPFEPLEDDKLMGLIERMMDRKHWLLGSNRRLPELEKYTKGLTKTTNRAIPIYLYGNSGPVRIVTPTQFSVPIMNPRIDPDEEVGDRIALAWVTREQFGTLRSQYMNRNIRPGKATLMFAVLVDGKIVGAFAFAPGKFGKDIYLLSDFPVAPSKHGRLSKLITAASLSKETKALAERSMSHRITTVNTTAFSNNPVSMKYRGIYQLAGRKENKAIEEDWADGISQTDSYYGQKFELNYIGELGGKSLDEILTDWKEKHASK